jgi:type IV secretory pathway VirB10-like protein
VKGRTAATIDRFNSDNREAGSDKTLFPIIDSGQPTTKEDHEGFLNERDLQRTVVRGAPKTAQARPTTVAGTLGSVAPFGDQTWQAPPYQPGSGFEDSDSDKREREAMEKSSLVYVRSASATGNSPQHLTSTVPGLGLGLATGTRLRARLESAASTAVHTPVLAVIEYNYERDGEIVVPAGTKAIGRIRDANRSGYVDIQFDSLLMPDGASVPIEAAATDGLAAT